MLGLVACATLVLGACAQSNTPTEYNDLTQQNFLETCTNLYFENTDDTLEITSDTVVADETGASPSICQCSYEVFVDNMSIEDFTTLNNDLKEDPEGTWAALPQNVQDGLADCNEDGGSTSPSTTSTTEATSDTTAG
jgi:hypothetical protein